MPLTELLLKFTKTKARILTVGLGLFFVFALITHNVSRVSTVLYGTGYINANNDEIRFSFSVYRLDIIIASKNLVGFETGVDFGEELSKLTPEDVLYRKAAAEQLMSMMLLQPIRHDDKLHTLIIYMQFLIPLLFTIVAVLVMSAFRRRVLHNNLCWGCGYPLNDVRLPNCPECGDPIPKK